ncbi:MAG: PP2C family protein-serine/threonine phosphatase [Acidobacteriaceae bacterium]
MTTTTVDANIDDYLRKRLMPVEGAIPQLEGIDMHGNSIPAGSVGGDLFEYINFQQRYNIAGRIDRAQTLSQKYLEPLPDGAEPRNGVDAHVRWLMSRPDYAPADEVQYRKAKSSEQLRIAEELQELYTTAGVLLVDAEGHGVIAAKIASTVHDTFHTAMLGELDRNGKASPAMFERINLRLAQSVTARNALSGSTKYSAREIATMMYGEIHPDGLFRFVSFGHPPPLIFSAEYGKFVETGACCMAHFPPLGLEIPKDHPDQSRYSSLRLRKRSIRVSDVAEITLMGRGDILFLYTDGVHDGSDEQDRIQIERIIAERKDEPAKVICDAVLEYAVSKDDLLRQIGESERIDDKTVFIIKSI